MRIRALTLAIGALSAAALVAGPLHALNDDGPRVIYREAEDLLPALEGFAGVPGGTETQAIARREQVGDLFSGNAGVLFENATPGNRFTLRFGVRADGAYDVNVRFGTGPDHGRVRAAVDGRPIGGLVDLYAAAAGRTQELTLGRRELAEGDHTLTVTVPDGAAAASGLRARVDYLELRP